MFLPRCLTAFLVGQSFTNGRAAASERSGFVQESSEPNAQRGGSGGSPSLEISWDTIADRTIPRILGYELQYAVAGRGETSDDAAWHSSDGHQNDTWDITVRVDGFDRYTRSNHTVGDGWFTLSFSRVYPKPSPLPDLLLETDPIGWDDTWEELEAKAQRAFRDSGHRQYSDWLVEVVRCEETEQRGDNHWAGGCPFLEYGGYTWHLRLSPPTGVVAVAEDYPLVHVVKETITGRWSGDGDQVVASQYGYFLAVGEENGGSVASSSGLVDPFFCQRGRCTEHLRELREATPYTVRLRAYNRNGFGPWTTSTTDASLWPADPMSTLTTAGAPALPQLKAPRLSSSTPTSLTVFVDEMRDKRHADTTFLEAYDFDIQPYDESDQGDTSEWTSVVRDADRVGPRELAIATGLSPSSRYRFRVRARHGDQLSPVSAISEVFTTGPGIPARAPSPPTITSVESDRMAATWLSWAAEGDEESGRGGTYNFEAQSQRLGSGYWQKATVTLSRDGEWQASAEGLAAYSQYTFRVRAVNDVGAGDWSEESDWARTDADVSYEPLGDEESVPGKMDPSIMADLPEKTRKAIEASFAAEVLKAQQEVRAVIREEEARRDREREHAQENKPRSSTVKSPEQFLQDYVRARQQGWAAAPHPGRAGPSVFGRTDTGLGHRTAKEWHDVEDGELLWMEEGRRVEEQELVSAEQEPPLPPLWTEESGGWWLDLVPSETPTPMSPLKRVDMELGMMENTEKMVMKESEDTGHEEDRVPELGLAKKQESPLATWPDEEEEQEELAETLVQQQQQSISQSPPLSPPLPPPPPTPDESVWMTRRRKRRTKGVGRAQVTGGVVAQHGRSRSSRPRRARVREK